MFAFHYMRKYVRFILVNDSCLTENMIQGFERRKTFSRIKAKHKDRRVMMEKFVEKCWDRHCGNTAETLL